MVSRECKITLKSQSKALEHEMELRGTWSVECSCSFLVGNEGWTEAETNVWGVGFGVCAS